MADKEELKRKAREEAKRKARQAKEKAQAVKVAKNAPVLITMPDGIGNAEADSAADLDAVAKAFRDKIKREDNRFELATDSEFWFAVCFQTREQKEHFLKAMSLMEHGDKYLDGQLVAERLGVTLPPADVPYKPDSKVIKTWLEFTDKD